MEKITIQQIEHLINFALNKKSESSDSCVIALLNSNESKFSLQYYLDNKISADFLLNNADESLLLSGLHKGSKKGTLKLSVDFSVDESENTNLNVLRNHIAKKLPIVEIIDFIGFALDCNVVTDVSVGKPFASYNSDYSAICSSNSVFEFTIDGVSNRDIKYGVTFSKEHYKQLKKDPKSKVEYASRATQFVDILVRRVMSKYNILTVPQAAVRFDNKSIKEYLSTLYLDENFVTSEYDSKDDKTADTETNSVQNQVKVLIRYQDTVNADSYCEDVIDDVYICTFIEKDEVTNKEKETIRFVDSLKIEAAESEDKKLGIARVNPIELTNIKKIKDFVEKKEIKFEIFNYLRTKKTNSNLAQLIKKRETLYKDAFSSKKDVSSDEEKKPIRVDFTVTPISIYSNHVVKKIINCKVSYKKDANPLLQDISLSYSTSFNPLEISTLTYTVDGKKDGKKVTESNPLVIAIKNNFVKNPNKVDACFALRDDTVNLYEIWTNEIKNNARLPNKFYNSKSYENVYFHKSVIVYLDENGSRLVKNENGDYSFENPLDSNKKTIGKHIMPYLNDDVGKCVFSNSYAHVSLLDSIDKSRVFPNNRIHDKDLVDGKVFYNGAEYTQYCNLCNEKYAARSDDWVRFIELHTAINTVSDKTGKKFPNIVCCDNCRNRPHKISNQTFYVFKNFKGELFADTSNLKHTSRCPACISDPFINTGDLSIKSQTDYIKCDVCGHFYCKNHVKQYANNSTNICVICNPVNDLTDTNCPKIYPRKFSKDDKDLKTLWKKIRYKLKTRDRSSDMCYFVLSQEINKARNELSKITRNKEISNSTLRFDNEVRVTVNHSNYKKIYFFICDDNKKTYILKKISKKFKEV